MNTSADGMDGTVASPPQRRRAPLPLLLRAVAGLALGTLSAAVELLLLIVASPLLALTFSRKHSVPRAVTTAALTLTTLERRRLAAFLGHRQPVDHTAERALTYLLLRAPVGLLGGVILALTTYGAAVMARLVVSWWITRDYLDGIPPEPWIVAYMSVVGLVLLFLAVQGLIGVIALERTVARRRLGPSPLEQYERRITQLAVSRAAVVEAVDDERRRIERDLHDGVQQRLVALGMLIGRARRAGDPERARDLLRQAHEESQRALGDLREVAWRVYPAALDREGLRAALETVAERSPVPVTIDYDVTGRPPHAVETAAYFVVCEAVTNATKHAGASHITIRVAGAAPETTAGGMPGGATGEVPGGAWNVTGGMPGGVSGGVTGGVPEGVTDGVAGGAPGSVTGSVTGSVAGGGSAVGGGAGTAGSGRTRRNDAATTRGSGMIFVRVVDDGAGGADPAGSGLAGLARRVAALDGAFAVHSPVGGPTVIRAALPCG